MPRNLWGAKMKPRLARMLFITMAATASDVEARSDIDFYLENNPEAAKALREGVFPELEKRTEQLRCR